MSVFIVCLLWLVFVVDRLPCWSPLFVFSRGPGEHDAEEVVAGLALARLALLLGQATHSLFYNYPAKITTLNHMFCYTNVQFEIHVLFQPAFSKSPLQFRCAR